MQDKQVAKGGKKTLHLYIGEKLFNNVQEMSEHYGLAVPEMIRMCITRHYGDIYRKEAFGYLAGVGPKKPGSGPGRPLGPVESVVQQINDMTNDQVTEWLNDPSNKFLTKDEREKNNVSCITSSYTGEREIFAVSKDGSYSRPLMEWPLFISELRKYLKKEQRDGNLN